MLNSQTAYTDPLSYQQLEALLTIKMSDTEASQRLERLSLDALKSSLNKEGMRRLMADCITIMHQQAVSLPDLSTDKVLDCCGTGGSGLSHYNTSTSVAFVLASGGVPVVKFGNRAITSASGSFDFLEGLGIPHDVPLERLNELLAEAGIAFLFAPQCYPSLGRFNTLRKTLGIRTIFNYLGPLLNPVSPQYRLLGVSDPTMQALMADHLASDGNTQQALVVRGEVPEGHRLDEFSCHGKTIAYEVKPNQVQQRLFNAEFLGESPFNQNESLSVKDNLAIFNRMLTGEDTTSYYFRMVCLNAGAGFLLAGKADSLPEGVQLAQTLLKDKAVADTVAQCRRIYGHGA